MRSATKRKTGKDNLYLAWLHTLPCAVCEALMGRGLTHRQNCPTEAAHVGTRGLSQKCPDREAIPLCSIWHHRESKVSAHRLGKFFFEAHGVDRDALIADLNAKYEQERAACITN